VLLRNWPLVRSGPVWVFTIPNNPAKKTLLLSSETNRGDEDVKVKPSINKVKKELSPLGDDSDCIAGYSKWSPHPTQMTASPITDIPAVSHLKNNPNATRTAGKSAQEIPIGAKITHCQPEMSGMSVLEEILSVNDDGSDSDG